MDPLAPVRDRAAEARRAAVAEGGSQRAGDVVAAALRQASATWELSSASSDNGVGSAGAVLMPEVGMPVSDPSGSRDVPLRILVSDAREPRDRMVKVAHELGHVLLHASRSSKQDGAAGTWVTEAGVSRFLGYSPRAAREVQADLFADEFLCPSPWLRERLAMGASPRSVERELDVPLGLVLRQAARSLLRPPTRVMPRAILRWDELDDEQRHCLTWSGGPLLVRGGPGTGKTTTLLARAREAIRSTATTASVLVVASGRAAAEDIHTALAAATVLGHGDATSGREQVAITGRAWIGTVTELALEIVSRWTHAVGLPEDFALLDRTDALRTLDAAASRIGVAPPIGRERTRALRAIDDERHVRAASNGDRRLGDHAPIPKGLTEVYEKELLARKAIDSGGLVPAALAILESRIRVREDYRRRFAHVLIDDVQDLSPAEVCLLAEIYPTTGSVWATTDPGQAIDGFRGRSGDPTATLVKRFAPARRRLSTNHRCGARVSSELGMACGRTTALDPGGTRSEGDLTILGVRDRGAEARGVVGRVQELAARRVAYGGQVVLARRHDDLARVSQDLSAAGIPVLHVGDLASRDEVAGVLAFVRFALDGERAAFERVAASPPYDVDGGSIRAVTGAMHSTRGDVREVLARLSDLRGVTSGARRALGRLKRHGATLAAGPFTAALSSWLFSPAGPAAVRLREATSPADEAGLVALHHLIKLCEETEAAGSPTHAALFERVRWAGSVDQHTHFRGVALERSGLDAVRLMTIHAARGMEFEAVHLAAFRPLKSLARTSAPSGPVADDRNVFRVALSRAKTHLSLVVPDNMAGEHEGTLWRLLDLRAPDVP